MLDSDRFNVLCHYIYFTHTLIKRFQTTYVEEILPPLHLKGFCKMNLYYFALLALEFIK